MPWEDKVPPSLRPEGSREPDSARRLPRPFRPQRIVLPPTQGIGLRPQPWAPSPGPLGRTEPDVLGLPCSGELVQLFCDEPLLARLEPRGQEPVTAVVLSDALEDFRDTSSLREGILKDEPGRKRILVQPQFFMIE